VSDFKAEGQEFMKAPLTLCLCQDCGLVQLADTVNRDSLYNHYYYRSGLQESMVESLKDVIETARKACGPYRSDSIWIDIGANDGTLLKHVPPSFTKIAYEPAYNMWPALQRHGRIAGRYFPTTMMTAGVASIEPQARVITSVACMYSVADPDMFVYAIAENLAGDGVWVNQMAYWPETMATNNFGDICHEHLTYWSLDTFESLVRRHGMYVQDFSFNDTNGGSFRTVVRHGEGRHDSTHDKPTLVQLKRFRQRMELQRTEVRDFLHVAKREAKLVLGYGASTKGNTYLQYWGITTDMMPFIADRNPEKIGKFTPTGQRIISEEEARKIKPAYFLALPWHFIDSFVEREKDWIAGGGRFIVPFPHVRIVPDDMPQTTAEKAAIEVT
jgi:NDP-4-keto-2,6-dideoxyhexose 3-C-methyltransferase